MWEVLLVLAITLVVITVLGHGLWLLAAFVIRALAGAPRDKRPTLRACPSCGRSTPARDRRCEWCGVALDDPRWAEMRDYSAFVRHLRHLERTGIVGADEVERLLARIETDRLQKSQAASPAPRVVPRATAPPPAPPVDIPVAELVDEPVRAAPVPPERGPTAQPTPPLVRQPMPKPERPLPPDAPRPRRSWAQLVEAFMEERNMRWGEIIGGLLIVGGGIALAISLREQLQAIPYSQFLIFAVITAGVYGAGLYSHYRWRLATTSRGLLTIALLLTPVSFLIMALLDQGGSRAIKLAFEAGGLAVFSWLAYLAARVLVADRPWLAVLGTVGNSAIALALTPLAERSIEPLWVTGVGLLPVAVLVAAVAGWLVRRPVARWLDVPQCGQLLTLSGTALFAWMVAEGHYLAEAARHVGLTPALDQFAVPLTVAAVATLLTGLTLLRRTAAGERLEPYRVAGTAIALVGMTAMLAAVGLAWPWPEMLLAVGLVDSVILAIAALRYRAPVLHAGVIFCASLVALVGYHAVVGHLFGQPADPLGRQLLADVTSAPSGNLLGILFVVSAAVAEWFVRTGRRRHGVVYAIGCGVLAAVGLSLVTWHGMDGGADALRAAILYGVYGLISVGLAARWNKLPLSYFGLGLVQAAALWAAWWQDRPLWLALLAFATVAAVVALALRLVLRVQPKALRRHVERLVVEPCVNTPLASIAVALPWLLFDPAITAPALAGHLCWLAALATALSFMARRSGLLAAAQAVWAIAAVAVARAWLHQYMPGWQWPDVRILQAHGIALATVSTAFGVARLALRGSRPARRLLDPAWPALDQLLHHALVAIQWLLVFVLLVPHLVHELGVGISAVPSLSGLTLDVGPGAWLLLALLAAGSLARLWYRFEDIDLAGVMLLAVTVPGLVAGRFAADSAVEPAWRWALAAAFFAASAVVWCRIPLARLARPYGVRARLSTGAVKLARGLLVSTAAGPVVVLTALAALVALAGHSAPGPLVGSFFDRVGLQWGYLVPSLAVVLVMVGYALRDRSAWHAFAAGAVVELAVVLAYLLHAGTLDTVEFVRLVQLVTVASAVWAVAWLLARRWTDAWGQDRSISGRTLMGLQLAEGVLANMLLLLPALAWLGLAGPYLDVVPSAFSGWNDWITQVGSPLGWAALLTCLAAIACRLRQIARQISPDFVALAGMTVLGLAACSVFGVWPEWGFRSLMLGWAVYSALVAMAAWWIASLRTEPDAAGPPQAILRAAAVWVRVAGLAAVFLGLWASPRYDEQLWAAAAIAVASVAGATMAVWRRREGWALAAALGVNLAATLAVWHHHFDQNLIEWWVDLLRANVIASASVALVWLAAVRRLYQLREPSVRENPLLTLQVALPAAGQTILCLLPIVQLAGRPESASGGPDWLAALGCPMSWLALGLAVAAAGWQSLRISRENVASVGAAALVGAATLATCHTAALADFGSYYFLTTALAAIALALVVAGMLAHRLAAGRFAPPQHIAIWATAVGALVVVLSTIHGDEDPQRPWWFASTLLSVSVTAGLLALWLRRSAYVCASGLVLPIAGTLIWCVLGPGDAMGLIETNVLALAVGSIVWSAIGLFPRGCLGHSASAGPEKPDTGPPLRYGPATLDSGLKSCPNSDFTGRYTWPATAVAFVATVALVVARLVGDVVAIEHARVATLSWLSLGATAAALAMLLSDRRAAWARPALYLLGLAAVGLALDGRMLTGRLLAWTAALELAEFALAAAAVGWALTKWLPNWQWPRETSSTSDAELPPPVPSATAWFSQAQQVVVVAAAVLAGWVALDPAFDACALGWLAGRVAGPIASAFLLAAALVMVRQTTDSPRRQWQFLTLVQVPAALCAAGWWRLTDEAPAFWIHQTVVVMASAAIGAVAAGVVMVRSGASRRDWLVAARRATLAVGIEALAALAWVLVLEGYFYLPEGAPMASWAIATVAAALVGLAAGLIVLAVLPGADPLGLSLRGRTVYVYGAELIGLVLGLHLWLTVPELFRLEIFERYWIYVVMGVAFLGAGLAEWFQRRGVAVLAEPLERTALALPLASAVGFWFVPDASPAFWFLAALFYGVMAVSRRNGWMALAAVVTGNMGLWVLWERAELHFLDRPQLWLIPAALCALVAEYLHHDRLKEGQSAAIRYMALSVIYVSSTVEFMRDIGESVWLPLVLVGLSVAGVLAGILLRVRSFLYLGVTFVMVVMVRMIAYAAFEQGRIWIFFASVVTLGLALFALFGFFEKRRNDVLAALERFKQWDQ